jgi:hypothetical protein
VYEENIYDPNSASGCKKHKLANGDVLITEPGNMAGPTVKGMKAFCTAMGNSDCNGIAVKAAFYVPTWTAPETVAWARAAGADIDPTKNGGRLPLVIKIVGSFVLTGVEENGNGKGTIHGYFTALDDGGPIGRTITTLYTTVLVK